jgi:hypothetical protein
MKPRDYPGRYQRAPLLTASRMAANLRIRPQKPRATKEGNPRRRVPAATLTA